MAVNVEQLEKDFIILSAEFDIVKENCNEVQSLAIEVAKIKGAVETQNKILWFIVLTLLGIFIEGPSRIGHYIRPAYNTSNDIKAIMTSGPVVRPDGKPHNWTFHYDPKGNDGHGRITMTFDDESVSMDLKAGARNGNAAFDRFGFVSWHRGGHYVELYFDDISYTARHTVTAASWLSAQSAPRTSDSRLASAIMVKTTLVRSSSVSWSRYAAFQIRAAALKSLGAPGRRR